MRRHFNTTGICRPDIHYMVDVSGRMEEIQLMVEQGAYFTVSRAHQYGKTTTLHLLKKKLEPRFTVFLISFEGLGQAAYRSETHFCRTFCKLLYRTVRSNAEVPVSGQAAAMLEDACERVENPVDLSDFLSDFCRQFARPAVLIIDEVDQAGGQEVFLAFLDMLRDKFLCRDSYATFQSVILAGVYDIRNLKLKLRPESEHRYNSPWNIAADFTVDMSFSAGDIAGMLKTYEQENQTGMDIPAVALLLHDYTSGYPFLVSRLCQLVDERLPERLPCAAGTSLWTESGIRFAVKELLEETNTLFDDIVKKLNDFPELREMLFAVLFKGEKIPYNAYHRAVSIGSQFGILRNDEGNVSVSNRIFETFLYNLFLSEETLNNKLYAAALRDEERFIRDGQLDMKRVLERFTESFEEIYGDSEQSFLEENGRRLFLLFLKPIINGTGNYYVEARTRDMRRTDVIVDYLGRQYICEMKIWRGEEYNRRGEEQLIEYLKDYHLTEGYLVSFNFNRKKTVGVHTLQIGEYTVVEAVV